ncbi:MAG TPA: CHAT domain-containing tetratricopeptide repeat protein [Saprospiraceae bacterium]|nr:CHAT domain-containing tetratricopeptide repeat protein [Saprospiraceae bacterium]
MKIILLSILLFFPVLCQAQSEEEPVDTSEWYQLLEEAFQFSEKGMIAEGLPFVRRALEIAIRDSTENSLAYGLSQDCLGYFLHHTGQFLEAEHCFERGVNSAAVMLGKSHEDYITRLSNLAMLHLDMGNLAQSVSELEEVVYLAKTHLEPNNPYTSIVINNLGLANEMVGNFSRALDYYTESLEQTKAIHGVKHARYGTRLANLAAINRKLKQHEKALELSMQACEVYAQTIGRNHPDYISAISGSIASYTALGRYKEGLACADTLLQWLGSKINEESLSHYHYIQIIMILYAKCGQYQKCIDLGVPALKKYQEIFPLKSNTHSVTSELIFDALDKSGRTTEAATFVETYFQFAQQDLLKNFHQLSETEQLKKYNAYHKAIDFSTLWFAAQHSEFPSLSIASFDYLMTVKGLSMTNRRQLFEHMESRTESALASSWADYQMVQAELARQYSLPVKKRKAGLDSLLIRSDQLERILALNSDAFSKASTPVTWKNVQQALAPGEAAVEFARVAKPETQQFWYVAWIVQPGQAGPISVVLFEESALGNPAAVKRLYTPEDSELYKQFWQPLQAALPRVHTLYYAPAGLIHLLNPGAIPVSASEVVADKMVLHRLVSTRQIPELKNSGAGSAGLSRAMVLGGVQYELDSTKNSDEISFSKNRSLTWGDNWEYLPGTLAEAKEARQQLTQAGVQVDYAEGAEASEAYFKSALEQRPQVLHLATHGFFQAKPDSSASHGFAHAENPMVRCGLILAGANRAWRGESVPQGKEDGILTAQEISRLNLSEVQLAILSACGTGQGKIEAGEGILGLQRALKMSGVDYVILTLWNVQDQHAREFMGLFYDAWLNRKNEVPQAFRLAQQQMRERYSKPFQPMAWAGFILLE